jgi:uncharacterized protein
MVDSSPSELQRQADSLLLYQAVLQSSIAQTFLNLLQALEPATLDATSDRSWLRSYGSWFHAQASEQISWPEHVIEQILTADNPFSQQAQRHPFIHLSPALIAAARQDLRSLHRLYRCDGVQISQWMSQIDPAVEPIVWEPSPPVEAINPTLQRLRQQPIWKQFHTSPDWAELVEELAAYHHRTGSGLFATYRAFRWQDNRLIGIAHPDPIPLDELVGYETQKAALVQNTEALLSGYPALHVLLYGSRGSGKSSLVKALLSRYASQGLRLVEVNKTALGDLPTIVDRLRSLPQSFLIFVDDLSFEEDDDAYKALKVVLEGNVTARPPNIAVYATSNRRHLIREFFGDRPRPSDADEVHAWDTVQEKLSFSDRFGLTLTFEPANQKTYLEIVQHLAQRSGIHLDAQELEFRALQWATRHNGRSGRTARQFVDFLRAELAALSTQKS